MKSESEGDIASKVRARDVQAGGFRKIVQQRRTREEIKNEKSGDEKGVCSKAFLI